LGEQCNRRIDDLQRWFEVTWRQERGQIERW